MHNRSESDDRGDTLIEVLIALVILGITGVALLTAFATAITASSEHRNLATLDASVRAASDQVISQVQQARNNAFGPSNCTNNPPGTSYAPAWSLSGSFTVSNYAVTYWNGSKFVAASALTTCTGYEPQLWTITLGSGSYSTTVSTVIYDPQPPPVSGGSTPYQLVFLAPTAPGTGTINASVSPQPIVAVEDQNGNIVYSNASSVTLTASGGPGQVSSNCSGVENEGIVSFSGCSFSQAGTYSLTAADSNATLIHATGASYVITTAPPAKVVFTSSAMTQTASLSSGATANMMTIQEQDAFGNPDPGALTVNLTSTSSNGFFTLSPGATAASAVTSVSIPAGQSSVSFYYGDTTAGSPTISAASAGLQTGTQTEKINPGTENKLVFTTPPSTVSAGTSFTVAVTVEDQFGNTITTGNTGSNDAIKLALSSNSFAAGTTTLNAANGLATFTGLKIDVPASYTITATDTTHATVTPVTSGSFTVTPAPPSQLVFTSTVSGSHPVGTTATVGPFAVKVEDQFGNAVANTGAPVSLLLSSTSTGSYFFTPNSGGSTSGVVTIPSGASTSQSFYYADTGAGTPTISASATVNSFIVSGTTTGFTMTPGTEKQLAITAQPPASVAAGASFSVGVTVQDQYGNTITTGNTGSTDNIHVALSSGGFSAGTTTKAAANGTVTFSGLQITAVGTYTITATDATTGTVTSATTNPFSIGAGTASKLAITTQPTSPITAGGTVSVGVTVEDQYGNPVTTGTGSNDNIHVALSSGTFASGTTTLAATNGVANFSSLQITTAGTLTITATDTSRTLATATTNSITVNPATENKLAITSQPASITAGGTVSVGVTIQDQYGNTITTGNAGSNDSILVTLSSGSFTAGTTTVAANNGLASFSGLQITAAGTYTITASDTTTGTVSGVTTNSFTVSPSTASKLAFTVQPAGSTGGVAFPTQPQVTVEDQYGNTITGNSSTVTLSIAPGTPTSGGPGAVSGCTQSETNGVITFSGCSINTAGTGYQLHATDGTLTATNSNPFNITVGSVAKFGVSAATPATAGTAITGITLTAEDAGGNTVTTYANGNHTVAWSGATTSPGGNAPTYPAGTVSFTNGVSTTALSATLDDAGPNTLTATSAGISGSANITVNPAAPNKVVYNPEPPTTGTAGSALASFGVSVEDSFGNIETTGNTGSTDTITLSLATAPTGGGFSSATNTYTNVAAVNGTATFAGVALNTAGSYTITATDTSRTLTTATSTPPTVIGAGAPNKVVYNPEPPTTGTAGGTLASFGVSVEDSFGNVVTSGTGSTDTITLSLATKPTGGAFNSATNTYTNVAAVNGTATFAGVVFNTAGSYTITATDTSRTLTTATSTPPTVVSPAAPNKVVYNPEPPTTGTAGSALASFGVSVEDSFGNVVTSGTGSTDTITLSLATAPTGGAFNSATNTYTNVAAVNGTATFAGVVFNTAGSYTITATDTSRTLTTATSTPPTVVSPAAPNKVVYNPEPPTTGTAGSALASFGVSVEDSFGNVVTSGTGSTDTITLSLATKPTGGGFNSATNTYTNVAAVNGTATFAGVVFNTAGSYTITATDTSRTLTTATSTPPTVIGAGAPNKVVYNPEPPTTGTAGSALASFGVSVEDSFGNVVTSGTGSTDTITLSLATKPTGGAFNSATNTYTNVAAVNGTATFAGVVFNTAGSYTITATDTSRTLTTATSTPPTVVSPAAPNKVVYNPEPPTTGTAGGTLASFGVSVEDSFGNIETTGNTGSTDTITLSLATAPTGGAFNSATNTYTNVAAVNGTATFAGVVFNTAGSYTITATDTSRTLTTATSTPPTVVSPAAPNKVVYNPEPPTTGTAGSALASFGVSVEDSFGNVVTSGTGSTDTITLSLATKPTGGGFNSATNTYTNVAAVNGTATFAGVVFNTAGSYTITATDTSRTLTTATSTPPTVIGAGAPNKVVYNPEPPTTGTAGSALASFGVSVEDSFGNVVTSGTGSTDTITLSLATAPTGGAFNSATNTYTNVAAVNGTATFAGVAFNTAGSYTITATDTSRTLTTATSTPPTVIGPATANKLVFTAQPANSTGGIAFPTQPQVTVEDQYGNTVTTDVSTVSLAIATATPTSGGPGTLSGCTQSETNGVITFSGCSINTSGTAYKLTATDGALASATSNAFNITVGVVAKFGVSAATPATAGTAITGITLTAEDAGGNTVTTYANGNHTVAWSGATTSPGGNAPTYPAGTVSFTNGVSTTALSATLDDAGPNTLTATSAGISGSANITVSPAAANKVVYNPEPPTTGTAGGTLASFGVSVEDSFGNIETTGNTGSTDTITLSLATKPTGGAFNSATNTYTNVAAVNGTATFAGVVFNTAGSYTITATDTSRTLTTATSTPPTVVSPAAPNKVVYNPEPPTTGTAGSALASFGVSVEDSFGNIETTGNTGSTDTITLSLATKPTGGGFNSATNTYTNVAAVNGTATFAGVVFNTAGSYTITATDTSRTLTTATSTPPTVIGAGAPNKVVYNPEPPTTGTAGSALASFGVSVEDSFGNVVTSGTGSTDTITLSLATAPTGGAFNSATNTYTNVAAVNGTATFAGVAFNTAGSYTITATDTSRTLTTATSTPPTVIGPATANKLVFTAQPANSTGGIAFPTQPQVTVEDQYGNTVTTDVSTVSLAIATATPTSGGPGTLSGCTQSETNGVITFSGCSINTSGTAYKLTATDGALASATSNAFNITVGVVAKFGVSAATPATAGTAITGITLTAEDAGGNTVTTYANGNHTVAWSGATTSPGGNAPTYPAGTVSFTNGVSTTALSATLDDAGPNTLTATSAGISGSATVLVNQAAASQLVYLTGAQTFVTGTGTAAGSGAITVQLQDAYGNPVEETANAGLSFNALSGVTYVASYGSTTACTASTCTIPAGSSMGTFYMTDTSASADAVTTTAGGISTASQTETAVAPGTPGGTVSITAQSGTLAPTGTATYTVTVTNTSLFTNERFEVLVGGLPAVATVSPTSCVSIPGSSSAQWTVTVNNTTGSIPAGNSTFSVVAERFSNASCNTSSGYVETSGSLVITPGSASQLAIATGPVSGAHTAGRTIGPILVQTQDAYGNPVIVGSATTVSLASSSGTGTFASTSGGAAVTSVTISGSSSFTTFYYGDTTAGSPVIATSSSGLASWSQKATVT